MKHTLKLLRKIKDNITNQGVKPNDVYIKAVPRSLGLQITVDVFYKVGEEEKSFNWNYIFSDETIEMVGAGDTQIEMFCNKINNQLNIEKEKHADSKRF